MKKLIGLQLIVLIVSVSIIVGLVNYYYGEPSTTGALSFSKLLKRPRPLPKIQLPAPVAPSIPPLVPVAQLEEVNSVPQAASATPLPADSSTLVMVLPDGVGAP
ncbi:MAG: hypothetical protein HY363_02795 [Candidatus Aenigmarchaeota archaeon]|nr:hypothetical protein [Candidatus Aenigmarchaeota archaeon]